MAEVATAVGVIGTLTAIIIGFVRLRWERQDRALKDEAARKVLVEERNAAPPPPKLKIFDLADMRSETERYGSRAYRKPPGNSPQQAPLRSVASFLGPALVGLFVCLVIFLVLVMF